MTALLFMFQKYTFCKRVQNVSFLKLSDD